MADEVIRSRLEFDASAFVAATQQQTIAIAQVATQTDSVRDRILAAAARLKETRREVAQVESSFGMFGSKISRAGRGIVRGLAISAMTPIVDEIGIPEAAAPLVHIGMSAWSGAQMGGLYGAAGFATITALMEVVRFVNRHKDDQDKLRAKVLQMEESIRKAREEDEKKQAEMRKEFEAELETVRIKERQKVNERFFETARLVASGNQ